MIHTGSRLLPELSLIFVTAAATHLAVSFSQTLMHSKLGHHAMGGKFFRNHINFHHTHYSKDHLVSADSCTAANSRVFRSPRRRWRAGMTAPRDIPIWRC